MDDEARTPSGLDPAHQREPRSRPPWGRRWPPRHPVGGRRQPRLSASGLRGARSRHQQLPSAGRAPDPRRFSRHRRIFAHHPPRRGHGGVGPARRGRDRPRDRGAVDLPRQDAQPRRYARAADRDRGLPLGRERRSSSARACSARSASISKSSTARPRRKLAAIGCTPLMDPACRGRRPVRHRRRLVRDRPARAQRSGERRPAEPADPRLGLAAGRRRVAGRALRRREGRPRALRGDGRRRSEQHVRRFAAEHCAGLDLAHDPPARHLRHRDDDRGPASAAASATTAARSTAAGWSTRRSDACSMSCCAMSYEERVASPCIGAERADLVLAGCAILEAIRRVFPCERLRVADRGLREGMLVRTDARRRRLGAGPRAVTRRATSAPLKVRLKIEEEPHASRRSAGSSASSTIPMWRAPSARACARAPPTS